MEQKRNQLAVSSLKAFNAVLTAENTQTYLKSVLGEKKQSFVNNITALVANNQALQACEPLTLIYASIKATALDLPLDPNLAMAHVIPYNNGKTGKVEAQLQLGWRAFVQLSIRSGQFSTMNVTDVRQGELQGYNLLTGAMEFQAVENREEKPVIGYVSYFRLNNGFEKIFYMTKDQVEKHAKQYSQTYGSRYPDKVAQSMWTKNFDAMAKKTVIKLLLDRWAPKSVEMRDAQLIDQAVFRTEGQADYVDNTQDAQAELEQQKEAYANHDIVDAQVVSEETTGGQEAQEGNAAQEAQAPKEEPQRTSRRKPTF